jgi:hypothetical protein
MTAMPVRFAGAGMFFYAEEIAFVVAPMKKLLIFLEAPGKKDGLCRSSDGKTARGMPITEQGHPHFVPGRLDTPRSLRVVRSRLLAYMMYKLQMIMR